MAGDVQLVVFSLKINDRICEYGVPIMQVQEINRLLEVTRMPQVPSFVEGIINLRGQIVPLIDLKNRFGMGKIEASNDTRIIVFDSQGQSAGIIVDDVQEVLDVDSANVEENPFPGRNQDSQLIQGVAKVEERLIVMLDLEKLLNQNEVKSMLNTTASA